MGRHSRHGRASRRSATRVSEPPSSETLGAQPCKLKSNMTGTTGDQRDGTPTLDKRSKRRSTASNAKAKQPSTKGAPSSARYRPCPNASSPGNAASAAPPSGKTATAGTSADSAAKTPSEARGYGRTSKNNAGEAGKPGPGHDAPRHDTGGQQGPSTAAREATRENSAGVGKSGRAPTHEG